jgi:hypothetical protein
MTRKGVKHNDGRGLDEKALRQQVLSLPEKNLSREAADRIFAAVRLSITPEQRTIGYKVFCESGCLWRLEGIASSMGNVRAPSIIEKRLSYALSGLDKLSVYLGAPDDEDIAYDLKSAFEVARSRFGKDYMGNLSTTQAFLTRLKAVLETVKTDVAKQKTQKIQDKNDVLAATMELLSTAYWEIFGRRPTYHNRSSRQFDHDTPFLRFASAATKEFWARRVSRPMSVSAIRQYFQRVEANKKKLPKN